MNGSDQDNISVMRVSAYLARFWNWKIFSFRCLGRIYAFNDIFGASQANRFSVFSLNASGKNAISSWKNLA